MMIYCIFYLFEDFVFILFYSELGRLSRHIILKTNLIYDDPVSGFILGF